MKNFTFQQGIEVHEHQFLDFADIRIGKDNRLFIDPYRVHLAALDGDVWAKKADALISSFFHTLLAAASQKDFSAIRNLILSTCGEINDTQLGFSSGKPCGNGASCNLIFPAIQQMIDQDLFAQGLVIDLADIAIWAPGIGPDHLSDWVTNIVWPVLHEFTQSQFLKYGLSREPAQPAMRLAWRPSSTSWENTAYESYSCDGHRILLCPKKFLHQKLLLSAEDFLTRQVLTYRQKEHLDQKTNLCRYVSKADGSITIKKPSKKTLRQYEVNGQNHLDYVRFHTRENPDLIRRYHEQPEFLPGSTEHFISDAKLDAILYHA